MAKIHKVDVQNPEASIREIGTPFDSTDHIFLGDAYFNLGEYNKAVNTLALGLKLETKRSILTSVAVEELIVALCTLDKRFDARRVVIDYGHLADPDDLPRLREFEATDVWPEGITNDYVEFADRAWLKTRGEKRPDLAEKLCTALIKLSPMNPNVWLCLAESYLIQRKFVSAIDVFTKYIELTPDSNEALIGRAFAYRHSGRLKECFKDVEKIRRLNCTNPSTADLLRRLGLDL